MANRDNVVVDFVADMDRFSPRLKDAPKQVRDSAAKINTEMNKIGEGGPSGLRGLASVFGRGSEFGLLSKTLMGGGAIIGLTMAARVVGELGTALEDFAVKARDGTTSMGELIGTIMRAIPVAGPFFEAGQKIREGIRAMAGGLTEGEADRFNKSIAGLDAMQRGAERGAALAGLTGEDKARRQAAFELEDKRRQLAEVRRQVELMKQEAAPSRPEWLMADPTQRAARTARQSELAEQAQTLEQEIARANVRLAKETAAAEAAAVAKGAEDRRKSLASILDAVDKESNALLFSRDALVVEKLARAGASQEDIRATMIKRQLADATKTAADRAREAAAAIEREDAATRSHVVTMIDALEKERGEYGLKPRMKQALEAMGPDVLPGQMFRGLAAVQGLAAQDEATKAMERAKAITESMRTPAEKYADTLRELNELLAQNADFQETYTRAVAAARKELEREGAAAGAIGGFEGIADTWRRIATGGMRETRSEGASESTVKTVAKHGGDTVEVLKRIANRLDVGVTTILGP